MSDVADTGNVWRYGNFRNHVTREIIERFRYTWVGGFLDYNRIRNYINSKILCTWLTVELRDTRTISRGSWGGPTFQGLRLSQASTTSQALEPASQCMYQPQLPIHQPQLPNKYQSRLNDNSICVGHNSSLESPGCSSPPSIPRVCIRHNSLANINHNSLYVDDNSTYVSRSSLARISPAP